MCVVRVMGTNKVLLLKTIERLNREGLQDITNASLVVQRLSWNRRFLLVGRWWAKNENTLASKDVTRYPVRKLISCMPPSDTSIA